MGDWALCRSSSGGTEDLCCLSADQKPDDDAVGYASCSELRFTEVVFQEEAAALQWLDDNTEKWGAALVVRAKTTVTEVQKPATLATPEELAGADKIQCYVESRKFAFRNRSRTVVGPPLHGETLTAWEEHRRNALEAKRKLQTARQEWGIAVASLQDFAKPFSSNQMVKLFRQRQQITELQSLATTKEMEWRGFEEQLIARRKTIIDCWILGACVAF